MSLKRLAEDLDSIIAGLKSAKPTSVSTKSGKLEVEGTVAQTGPSLDEVVRATFDYVTSQLKESDGATSIGEAFMVACSGIAKDAGLDEAKVQAHALMFLEEIVEAARSTL